MTPIRCPRCHGDVPELTAFCAACGAPLLLDEEEPRRALDATLDLDRRGGLRGERERAPAPPPVTIPGPAATPAPRNVVAPPSPAPGLGPGPGPRPSPGPGPSRGPGPGGASPARNVVVPGIAAPPPPAAQPSLDVDELPEPDVDALEVHLTRAATWRRVLAWVVDGVPFAAAGAALGWSLLREAAAGRARAPVGLEELVDLVARERVIALCVAAAVVLALVTYATLAHTLAGATLGKRLAGIRVVGPDGAPPSFARSAIRSALCVTSIALFGVGFLLALFTRTGRALHDLLARTWVVKAP